MGLTPITKWHHLVNLLFSSLFLLLALCSYSDDKVILLEFRSSLSDPNGLLSTWDLGKYPNHCSWYGVRCDAKNRVVELNVTGGGSYARGKGGAFVGCGVEFSLYGNGRRRDCKGSKGSLVGKLPPVVAGLSELKVLSLPFHAFGGEFPRDIWEMKNLEVLDLEGNMISGSLPGSLSGLRGLRVLNLGFNRFTGGLAGSLASCTNLEFLNLAGNQINGSIPGFLGRLKSVYLSLNRLSGTLPEKFGENCNFLEHLDLSGNILVGGIPRSLGNCGNLVTLLLYSNLLDEVIPVELGRLQKLEVLDISRNSFSGKIPSQIGNCSSLSVLVLSNSFDPYRVVGIASPEYYSESADVDFNLFYGGIPPEVLSIPSLKMIWAPSATLGGKLPAISGSCDRLEMINLADNLFTGPLPDGLRNCQRLFYVNLSHNSFDGGLFPELPVSCMSVFDVSNNSFSGDLPSFNKSSCWPLPSKDFVDISSAYLAFFAENSPPNLSAGEGDLVVVHSFAANKFSGVLRSMPISSYRLGKRTSYSFNAAKNMLSGSLSGILMDKCEQLKALYVNVSSNRISGQIPTDFGSICSSLVVLDFSRNQISGTIPPSISLLTSLLSLNLSWNLLEGSIPSRVGNMKGVMYISLAGNNLNGSIPSSFGMLDSLEVLDLSSNLLAGEIPSNVVKLKNLTALLLNDNKLSGRIPGGVANATTLLSFNVSFNNLSGPLPWSEDLLKCDSIIGNPYLSPCRAVSLAVPSSDSPVSAIPAPIMQRSGNVGFNSIEIASIASASAILSVLIALIAFFIYTRKWIPRSRIMGSIRKEVTIFTDIGVPITFENVVRATGGFNASNCIGHGGFGATYKAEISPGNLVAIKRLAVGRFNQGVQQFHAEIKTLARLHHPNLVTLIGYHASETEMFLIYNYLPGGNLEKFIQERSTRAVHWRVLHKIALDIARALAYLHDQCVPRVLHRDVKPSNILLDEEFNAYLSDFGLARLLGTSETHATTGVAGTFGYVAPEYAMTCRVSDKADVYSYGVVLLELLSDKKALDPSFSSFGNGFNIVAWACMLLKQGRAKEFFTSGLWDAGPHDDLVEVLHLALVCTVDSLSTRPTMKLVVRRLKQLQPPSC